MTALRKKVLAAPDLAQQRLAHARIVVAVRGERAHERRPDELALLLVERGQELRHHRGIGIVLEEAVRDRAQPIVRAGQRLAHRVLRPRIVEAGEQHERAIADVAVGLLGDRLQQRRHRLAAAVRRTVRDAFVRVGVVEIAELVDGGLQLRRRDGLRRARLLAASRAAHRGHRGHTRTQQDEPRVSSVSRIGVISRRRLSSAIGSVSSFSASCR